MSSSTVEFFHVLVSLGFEPRTSRTLAEHATPRPWSKGNLAEKNLPIQSANTFGLSYKWNLMNTSFFLRDFFCPLV